MVLHYGEMLLSFVPQSELAEPLHEVALLEAHLVVDLDADHADLARPQESRLDELVGVGVLDGLDRHDLCAVDDCVQVDDALVTWRDELLLGQFQHGELRLKLVAHLAVVEIVADYVPSGDVLLLDELYLELDVLARRGIRQPLVFGVEDLLYVEVQLSRKQGDRLVFDKCS